MANQPKVVTATVAGPTAWMNINPNNFRDGVGLLATVNGGNATYTVEVTGDKRNTVPTHINKHDVLQNLTASANSSLAYACSAIRLNVASISVGASVTLSVVQVMG